MDRYEDLNRANWDERAPAHAASADYAFERFASDPSFISDVVRFDLPRLGDITGLRGVHLQCHIGTDTVSLARLGARMTGLDYSPEAIAQARRLAPLAGADVEFVQAEVYDALSVLEPRPMSSSRRTARTTGTAGSARSSRRCSTSGSSRRCWSSTTRRRGTRYQECRSGTTSVSGG
jgi:hypothetical protein